MSSSSDKSELRKKLASLQAKSKHLNNVAEYFDSGSKVLVADGVKGNGSKGIKNIETQLESYLLDALRTVAGDIDGISQQLMSDIDAHMDAVNALNLQAGLVKTQIDLGRDYFMLQKINTMTSNKKVEKKAKDKDEKDHDNTSLAFENGNYDMVSDLLNEVDYRGISLTLEERVKAFEDVGVVLHEEEEV
jgi:hypothetical protein